MVSGPIGYCGIENIEGLHAVITEKGFDAADHLLENDMDYPHIHDLEIN